MLAIGLSGLTEVVFETFFESSENVRRTGNRLRRVRVRISNASKQKGSPPNARSERNLASAAVRRFRYRENSPLSFLLSRGNAFDYLMLVAVGDILCHWENYRCLSVLCFR